MQVEINRCGIEAVFSVFGDIRNNAFSSETPGIQEPRHLYHLGPPSNLEEIDHRGKRNPIFTPRKETEVQLFPGHPVDAAQKTERHKVTLACGAWVFIDAHASRLSIGRNRDISPLTIIPRGHLNGHDSSSSLSSPYP
ncbi:hypothetical protein WN48_09944 [Eufriesea mexicana]|uniref:Uncharacterized protein n=1 Tax=Eufriesea mexicana TaxID=516756 RepID=A0A310SID8_9HYME|nr:hypothetical protein WN48_09944 [Eufriesea mexicana]